MVDHANRVEQVNQAFKHEKESAAQEKVTSPYALEHKRWRNALLGDVKEIVTKFSNFRNTVQLILQQLAIGGAFPSGAAQIAKR